MSRAQLISPARMAIVSIATTLVSCAGSQSSNRPEIRTEKLGPDLQLVRVTDVVWIHISEDQTDRWGTIPANGLLLTGDRSSVLVDTGWKVSQAQRLMEFAEHELGAPVHRVIVTHAHSDRIGGLEALSSPGAVIYAQEITAKRIAKLELGLHIETYSEEMHLTVGDQRVEVYYPGPGHSRDNSVIWMPDSKILFAGCILKSGRSFELGNREDAVLSDWPGSVIRLMARYGEAELIVPGHGPPGRVELMHHTLGLLQQAMSTTTLQ